MCAYVRDREWEKKKGERRNEIRKKVRVCETHKKSDERRERVRKKRNIGRHLQG